MPEGNLLSLTNVAVKYGDVSAVRNVSLEVRQGEIVSLLGANGAGKTTTLRAICRLENLAGGQIEFDGKSLANAQAEDLVKLGIAMVPERRRIFGGLSVVENLEMGAYGRPRAFIKDGVAEMLDLFPNLKKYAPLRAAGLSGGEQQMLAIARALMSHPRLLLLDEPSLGLAPLLVEQVFDKLEEVNRKGTTMLLVEQNASLALDVSSRAYVLESGVVTIGGPTADLIANPHVQNAYLGGD